MKPQGNERNLPRPKIMKTTLLAKDFTSTSHNDLAHKFTPWPQAMAIPDAKAAVDKEWKTLQTIPARDLEKKSRAKREVLLEAQRDKKESPLCHTDGHMSPQKCGDGTKITQAQRQSRAPGGH